MTTKFVRFVAALEALCREHDVQLCTSTYDGLQVWEGNVGGENPIHAAGIEDFTIEEPTDAQKAGN